MRKIACFARKLDDYSALYEGDRGVVAASFEKAILEIVGVGVQPRSDDGEFECLHRCARLSDFMVLFVVTVGTPFHHVDDAFRMPFGVFRRRPDADLAAVST